MRLERSEELVVVSSSFTSSTSSSSWKRDMVDSLVRSISTSIQLLSMEAVFSISKWSEEKVSRRPPCPRNCVSMVGVVVVVVVYLIIGKELLWGQVVYSADWHPTNHISFYSNWQERDLDPEWRESHPGNISLFDEVVFAASPLRDLVPTNRPCGLT